MQVGDRVVILGEVVLSQDNMLSIRPFTPGDPASDTAGDPASDELVFDLPSDYVAPDPAFDV